MMRMFAIVCVACQSAPGVTPVVTRQTQTAPDFLLHAETGEPGARGGDGPRGPSGSAVASGLNLACAPNALRVANNNGVDTSCSASPAQRLVIQGGAGGVVNGATVADPTPTQGASVVVTAGAAVAVHAESSDGTALRVAGTADFSNAAITKLPLRWVVKACSVVGDPLCQCSANNQCTSALALCASDETFISGNCQVPPNATHRVIEKCPTTGGFGCALSAATDSVVGQYCRHTSAGTATVTAYALCLRKQ